MSKRQKRGYSVIAAILIAALAIGSPQIVQATSSANSKKKTAERNLDDVNKKIDDLQNKKSAIQSEISSTNEELVNLLVDVGILEDEIADNQKQLDKVTADLEQAQEDEQKQYDAMKKRIKFMYEKGDTAVVSSILESKSMADMLNRVEYFNEVYGYDRDLLTAYQDTRQQVEDLKQQVEDERAELEMAEEELKQQQAQLQKTMDSLKSQQANADTQIANAKELASQYKQTIAEQNRIIQQQTASKSNNTSSGGNSSGGSSSGGSTASTGNLNPSHKTNVSGSEVVNYALQFVGNPYVWGGKDPNTGADCSGFTSYVYAHFGVSIPSYSGAQRNCGQEVSYSNAQPGDLICYAGHVAIYMGNGQIVHAKGTKYGIVAYDNATYKTIISVRRVL